MEKENCYIGGNEWDLEEILKSMVLTPASTK